MVATIGPEVDVGEERSIARPSLKQNAVWSLVGSVSPMALGAFTIPYLIKSVGVEAFGILSLVWSIIGYFSVFDFGIGRALTHQVSGAKADRDFGKLPPLVKRGLISMAVTGAAGAVLLAALADRLATSWLNVSPALQSPTAWCLALAALGIPLSTITSALKGVLEGFEDFKSSSVLRIILGIANFGLPAITAAVIGPSLLWMVVSLVAARLAVLLAHFYVVAGHLELRSILRAPRLSASATSELFTFGAWMTASNLITPLMVTADRFIISFLLGAAVVAYYTVPFDVVVRLLVIPASLTGPLFPRLSDLYRTSQADAKQVYRRSLVLVAIAMAAVSLPIIAASYWGLSLWLGHDFASHSWVVASILGVGLLFNSLAQVPYAALQATGSVRVTSIAHIIEFAFYVPMLYLLLRSFGVPGAAVAWVARVGFDCLILSVLASRRFRT